MKSTDIDIDVAHHTDKAKYGVRAINYNEDEKKIVLHQSGIYLDCGMPIDPETGYAAIDYKDADRRGFFKVDLLNVSVYSMFSSKDEILACLKQEPRWSMLDDPILVSKLPHIGSHYDLVSRVRPRSINDLADVLALIRPGKRHLVEKYLTSPRRTKENLYRRPLSGAWFKKSHSIGYAHMIVLVMNRLEMV